MHGATAQRCYVGCAAEWSHAWGDSAGLLYWVCHAHGRLIIMHSAPPPDDVADGDASADAPAAAAKSPEYHVSVTLPPAAPAPGEPPGARNAWHPLVTRRDAPAGPGNGSGASRGGAHRGAPVIALEDMVLFRDHLVLCCRRDGVPALLTAPWRLFGIGPPSSDAAVDTGAGAPTAQFVEDLPELPLPEWALQVAAGANLDFEGDTYVCHAAAPAHPEQELRFHLPSRRLLPLPPLSAEALEAVEGIRTERLHVRSVCCACWALSGACVAAETADACV